MLKDLQTAFADVAAVFLGLDWVADKQCLAAQYQETLQLGRPSLTHCERPPTEHTWCLLLHHRPHALMQQAQLSLNLQHMGERSSSSVACCPCINGKLCHDFST